MKTLKKSKSVISNFLNSRNSFKYYQPVIDAKSSLAQKHFYGTTDQETELDTLRDLKAQYELPTILLTNSSSTIDAKKDNDNNDASSLGSASAYSSEGFMCSDLESVSENDMYSDLHSDGQDNCIYDNENDYENYAGIFGHFAFFRGNRFGRWNNIKNNSSMKSKSFFASLSLLALLLVLLIFGIFYGNKTTQANIRFPEGNADNDSDKTTVVSDITNTSNDTSENSAACCTPCVGISIGVAGVVVGVITYFFACNRTEQDENDREETIPVPEDFEAEVAADTETRVPATTADVDDSFVTPEPTQNGASESDDSSELVPALDLNIHTGSAMTFTGEHFSLDERLVPENHPHIKELFERSTFTLPRPATGRSIKLGLEKEVRNVLEQIHLRETRKTKKNLADIKNVAQRHVNYDMKRFGLHDPLHAVESEYGYERHKHPLRILLLERKSNVFSSKGPGHHGVVDWEEFQFSFTRTSASENTSPSTFAVYDFHNGEHSWYEPKEIFNESEITSFSDLVSSVKDRSVKDEYGRHNFQLFLTRRPGFTKKSEKGSTEEKKDEEKKKLDFSEDEDECKSSSKREISFSSASDEDDNDVNDDMLTFTPSHFFIEGKYGNDEDPDATLFEMPEFKLEWGCSGEDIKQEMVFVLSQYTDFLDKFDLDKFDLTNTDFRLLVQERDTEAQEAADAKEWVRSAGKKGLGEDKFRFFYGHYEDQKIQRPEGPSKYADDKGRTTWRFYVTRDFSVRKSSSDPSKRKKRPVLPDPKKRCGSESSESSDSSDKSISDEGSGASSSAVEGDDAYRPFPNYLEGKGLYETGSDTEVLPEGQREV